MTVDQVIEIAIDYGVAAIVGVVIAYFIKKPVEKYFNEREERDTALSKFMSIYFSSILKKVDALGEIVILQATLSLKENENHELEKLIESYKSLERDFKDKTANNMANFM